VKQKNIILMVVAVGCGLVAAFLTSQMSGGPAKEVPLVDVIVATKELPPGTKFTKDSLKDQVKKKKIQPTEIPQNAIQAEDELVDKQLIRTLRADDYVGQGDLGTYKQLDPPSGKDLITIRLQVDKVTPFVKSGSRIDLIGTGIGRNGIVKGMVLIPYMLVMAVDLETAPPNGVGAGRMNIQVITLAASPEESLLIRLAETANVQLSFILKSDNSSDSSKGPWDRDKVVKWLNDQQDSSTPLSGGDKDGLSRPQAVATAKIKVSVPSEDIPLGTELTAEVIDKKFSSVEFAPPAPENVVIDMKEHVGKFLNAKIHKGLFVPKDAITDKKPGETPKPETPKPDVKKAGPSEDGDSPKAALAPEKKKESLDRTFTSSQGTKVLRYEREEGGEWKLLGEVGPDGVVAPVQGTKPAPKTETPPPPPANNGGGNPNEKIS
jgi:pilus assembly protein CpaB